MDGNDIPSGGKCPVMHGTTASNTTFSVRSNRDWWPNQLNLKILHQNSDLSNPMAKDFDYKKRIRSAGLRCPETGHLCADDRQPGMVAG